MKKLIGIIIGLVLIGVVTYFGFSFYISQMTKEPVRNYLLNLFDMPDSV